MVAPDLSVMGTGVVVCDLEPPPKYFIPTNLFSRPVKPLRLLATYKAIYVSLQR